MNVAAKPGSSPETLMQAHELLSRMRPSSAASSATWLKYYRHSAAVYAEIAEVDRGHHHEALYWANRERAKANAIAAEIANNPDRSMIKRVREVDEPASRAAIQNEL
jgi:hypothetical protein